MGRDLGCVPFGPCEQHFNSRGHVLGSMKGLPGGVARVRVAGRALRRPRQQGRVPWDGYGVSSKEVACLVSGLGF